VNFEADATFKHLHGMLKSILSQKDSPIAEMIREMIK
jgi:hypothetical protein